MQLHILLYKIRVGTAYILQLTAGRKVICGCSHACLLKNFQ